MTTIYSTKQHLSKSAATFTVERLTFTDKSRKRLAARKIVATFGTRSQANELRDRLNNE